MPMESQAQRRWMWATHPTMARRWEEHTPKGKKLPEKVSMDLTMIRAFRDELEKISSAASKVLTSIPKIRPHVNPETIFGGRQALKTVGARGARGAAQAAHAAEGTAAGVLPKSVPQQGATRAGVMPAAAKPPPPVPEGALDPTYVRPAPAAAAHMPQAAPAQAPQGQSMLRRFGPHLGASLATGVGTGLVGSALASRRQQQSQ